MYVASQEAKHAAVNGLSREDRLRGEQLLALNQISEQLQWLIQETLNSRSQVSADLNGLASSINGAFRGRS